MYGDMWMCGEGEMWEGVGEVWDGVAIQVPAKNITLRQNESMTKDNLGA